MRACPPQCWWYLSTVLDILHSTGHPPQCWTSSTVLNILHSVGHSQQYWISSTVLNILHSVGHPSQHWTSISTSVPYPHHCINVHKGDVSTIVINWLSKLSDISKGPLLGNTWKDVNTRSKVQLRIESILLFFLRSTFQIWAIYRSILTPTP